MDESLPLYAFVPGGPWPHPTRSPEGHPARRVGGDRGSFAADDRDASALLRRGALLFNEGYYWEAHESWEALWHALGRRGVRADVVKALIKLAAAGVKVRERRPRGVATHAGRAAALLEAAKAEPEGHSLGLDLNALIGFATRIAADPPRDPEPPGTRVSRVFPFRIVTR